jgi:lysyl-tRNA synthetase class 2
MTATNHQPTPGQLAPEADLAAIDTTSELLWRIRTLLREDGFRELITPVFRRADDLTGKRVHADVGGPGFLRSMIGPALRYTLRHAPRVFEIGPCFRSDDPDTTHSREFTMLDLYAAGEDYTFLTDLAQRLVRLAWPGKITAVSVAGHLAETLGIDLIHQRLDPHTATLAHHLALPAATPLHELLDAYIRIEIEPLTTGAAVFLTDMPLGGNEPCAQRRHGTAAILDRFEIFIDGIEVVHGYQDEPDSAEFIARATTIGLYNPEQALVQNEIRAGSVPAHSVGLGLGIERLCMAATGIHDIHRFRPSRCF